jgi:ubiquinone/menaquinone biosynthesis C-methylase UbiE
MVSGFISPRKIINDHLVLESTMKAADFGCGSGEWTIPLAELLENGKVYAIDLLEEPLSVVRGKARDKGLENIELVKSDIEGIIPRLLANSLDLVLMANLLFQVKDRPAVFAEASRVLKVGGRVLAIEWNEDAAIGPPQKVAKKELKSLAAGAGFAPIGEFKAGSFHYGLVLKKNK